MSDSVPETGSESDPPTIFDACTPREDVLTGNLAEDQFAASLADVAHTDEAPAVYADPQLFFEKTYPTTGLQTLLERLARRFVGHHRGEYSGTNGVLRLDTSFGGGKTHNQIAAYHVAEQPTAVPDLTDFLHSEEVAARYTDAAALGLDVNTAVFVGTHVSSKTARSDYTDPEAPDTNTMWGELAYQLFGQDGYEFLREYDESRTAPGSAELEQLFGRQSNPSLVLIDEIAAYLEQAASVEVADSTLAKQTNTFLMSLLSVTQNTDNLTVVTSIADTAFHDRADDVRGLVTEVVSEFNTISDRTEGSITPTEDDELAAVLRHRLFERVPTEAATATAETYARFYRADRESFPEHTAETSQEDRLADSYPVHPTVIDTLTEELDSLPSFQKTRGALRLLSRGVARLWQSADRDRDRHFVRLFDLHPSDSDVLATFLRLLDPLDVDFEAAIKNDIYSEDETAHAVVEDRRWTERGHPPLGTQLATTILWKSVVKGADGRGTTRRPTRYAVAHEGVELAHYDDALNNLLGEGRQSACFYLHGDAGEKIQFKSEANLTKMIDSVVDRLRGGLARRHLEEALESALGHGSLNEILGPEEPHDVPDEPDLAHLCVMDFDTVTVEDPTAVPSLVETLYQNHAAKSGGPHSTLVYKNNVTFLVATADAVADAQRTARRVAAIKRIDDDSGDEFDLNDTQRDKLGQKLDSTKATLDQDVKKAYRHLYYPTAAGLTHHRITTTTTIHAAVLDRLEENGAIIPEDEEAYAEDWFDETLWNSSATRMTTAALEEQFGKRRDAEILLSPVPLRKTVARVVDEGAYAYWNDEAGTGAYGADAKLWQHDEKLSEAANLDQGLSYSEVEISSAHRVYDSVDALVEAEDIEWDRTYTCPDCGEEFDTESGLETHDCGWGPKTCDDCGEAFTERETYRAHLPCGGFAVTARGSTDGAVSVSRAIQEVRAETDPQLADAREEYHGPDAELESVVRWIQIEIVGADAWKGAWFTANKLQGADQFADHTEMFFEYGAVDGADSEVDLTFEGTPAAFAEHFRFNIEPEEFSARDGERTAAGTFTVEFTTATESAAYEETFDALAELLDVQNPFTVELEAEVEIRARDTDDV